MSNKMHKVAFTAFRNNLALYLEKIAKGEEIQVVNARRGRIIVELMRAETSKS